jgi:hypothetical protein
VSELPREHPATPQLTDWLRQVAQDLKRAEARLQHDVTPQREAVQRELVQAAVSVGRALHLIGAGP